MKQQKKCKECGKPFPKDWKGQTHCSSCGSKMRNKKYYLRPEVKVKKRKYQKEFYKRLRGKRTNKNCSNKLNDKW